MMPALTETSEVASALAELGLKEEKIAEAIRRGERWRNATTSHHPKTAPGWYAWSEATTALRDLVVPDGGAVTYVDGFERCVCPTKRDEIAVLAGDQFTGDPERNPQPKYMKPRVVAQGTIARSQLQMFKPEEISAPRPGRRHLWFLMVRREGDNAIAELSRPGGITDAGRINVWERRIILAPIPVGASVTVSRRNEETEPVEIDVVPRDE
jgi:hypothetical protein